MNRCKKQALEALIFLWLIMPLTIMIPDYTSAAELDEITKTGVLRHLGVPYASFVTGSGDGLDVELVTLFARHMRVSYKYVKTSWENVIGDLTGKRVRPIGEDIKIMGDVPVKGDIIANGLTVLPWRKKIVDYSVPTFITQVWLITRADSPIRPIKPVGDIQKEIASTKSLLRGHSVLGVPNTCLDPSLYGLNEAGADVKLYKGNLNELVPAMLKGEAELSILDVPDVLIALEKWSGEIKIIGPVSPIQEMGYAFAKTSPRLREAFNRFFEKCRKNGTYIRLVKKYYPHVFDYYPAFFQ